MAYSELHSMRGAVLEILHRDGVSDIIVGVEEAEHDTDAAVTLRLAGQPLTVSLQLCAYGPEWIVAAFDEEEGVLFSTRHAIPCGLHFGRPPFIRAAIHILRNPEVLG